MITLYATVLLATLAGIPQLRWQAAHAWWKVTSRIYDVVRWTGVLIHTPLYDLTLELRSRASLREAIARERRDSEL